MERFEVTTESLKRIENFPFTIVVGIDRTNQPFWHKCPSKYTQKGKFYTSLGVQDSEIESRAKRNVDNFVKNPTPTIIFLNSDLYFLALRVQIMKNRLWDKVQVVHFHENNIYFIKINEKGKLSGWPSTMLGTWDRLMEEILGFLGH